MLLLVTTLSLSTCDSPDRIADRIRAATVPPGGRTLSFDQLRRDGTAQRGSWQIETTLDWPHYAAWATAQVDRLGFQRTPGEAPSFVRYDGLDVYRLELVHSSTGTVPRILVSLVIIPD